MPIKGLSERRRLPRLGKVKTGIFVQTGGTDPRTGKPKGHPKAVDYFVIASPHPALLEAAEALYGTEPRSLDIMFPVDDVDQLFPQDYKAYRASGLYCSGDGERARRWEPTGMVDRACPCDLLDKGECKPSATLSFMLPRIPGLGVWSYTTSGNHAIVGLNSELEMFHRAFGGLRGVPFTLVLEPQEVSRHVEGKGPQKTTIHVPRIMSERSLIEIVDFRKALGAQTDPMLMLGAAPDAEEDDAPEVEGEPVKDPSTARAGNGPTVPHEHSAKPIGAHAPEFDAAAGRPIPPAPAEGAGLLMDECFELALRLDVDAATYRAYLTNVHGTVDLDAERAREEILRLKDAAKSPHTAGAAKAAMRARARRGADQGSLV